ncbi:hypothetical protein LCGC14_1397250 [marine sediment metagenome]|uniref:Cdc6 C-terminal domain-containing protein n=1 Tax=marine sediment metagenome TaxID=412755 RepID=A0A0F9KJ35_9ZZZZ
MDFFLINLKETLEAINKLMDKNISIVNTKRIRRYFNIKSSNRSKINFIWRTLKYLEGEGILRKNGITNPKTYKIVPDENIDIDNFLSEANKNKKKII